MLLPLLFLGLQSIVEEMMNTKAESLRKEIASDTNIEDSWEGILREILNLFDCSTGTIHAFDRERALLVIKAHHGIPVTLLPRVASIPIGKGMAGIAAERREPVQVCNLQTDDSGHVMPAARETMVEGAITVPMLYRGELYGTIGIAKPRPYEFSVEEIAALVGIAAAGAERLAPQAPECR